MDYVSNLDLKQQADFNMLKLLVVDMANEAMVDLFDNVFDWSFKLVEQNNPELNKQEMFELAKNYKFNDY